MAAYCISITEKLSTVLRRFVTLNAFQLVGHVANLEFWSDEVAHCLQVLDQYHKRFNLLVSAEKDYIAQHKTFEFELNDQFDESSARPLRSRRISEQERRIARAELCEAFYRFLIRCLREKLIDEEFVRRECVRHDIGIDPQDLAG